MPDVEKMIDEEMGAELTQKEWVWYATMWDFWVDYQMLHNGWNYLENQEDLEEIFNLGRKIFAHTKDSDVAKTLKSLIPDVSIDPTRE